MNVEAAFVRSAATAEDLPRDGAAEIALVGRSNVGKSSLINALVRQRIARTSAAPGKTRLANIYRVRRGANRPFYLVDLPGYGYARGARADIEAAVRAYAGERLRPRRAADLEIRGEASASVRGGGGAPPPVEKRSAALLVIDSRHPGLESDRAAWTWLQTVVSDAGIVATKIDKLSRAERLRAMRENEAVFEHPVLPVSAVTGEGLDELWKLIERLTMSA